MFKRGFKTSCERLALQKRADVSLRPADALDPRLLATALGATVVTPTEIPGLSPESLSILLKTDPDSWSAATLRSPGLDLMIINSAHSPGRQASDLMHELSHVLLGHKASRIDVSADQQLLLRTHDPDQESEANWLAGCLLLPRPALLAIRRKGITDLRAAQHYGVSLEMLQYRMRVTGVLLQARRAGVQTA